MKMASSIKVVIILIALAGIAAIAWFLYGENLDETVAIQSDSGTVEVARDAPAESASEPEKTEPAAEPEPAPALSAEELAAMSPADALERFTSLEGEAQEAFVSDYVSAIGEREAISLVGDYRKPSNPDRNEVFAFALARAALEQYDARLGAYYVGLAYHTGQGVEADLEKALEFYRHPALEDSPVVLFKRASILSDPDFPKSDKAAAVTLLQRVVAHPDSSEALVKQAQEQLGNLE